MVLLIMMLLWQSTVREELVGSVPALTRKLASHIGRPRSPAPVCPSLRIGMVSDSHWTVIRQDHFRPGHFLEMLSE